MAKKKKNTEKIDGLGPQEKAKIRVALRRVWAWSHARKLVLKRCELPNNYAKCEKCLKKVPKIFVDHITKVGEVDEGFIARLFVPSGKMQGLCKTCHDAKTKEERRKTKVDKVSEDFY